MGQKKRKKEKDTSKETVLMNSCHFGSPLP